ncbi:MAG TPA: hypothetical protein VEF76_10975 [Patescibacteria group bacterium]|nr:hypothetical protein [Patescibacteria group bacterium]
MKRFLLVVAILVLLPAAGLAGYVGLTVKRLQEKGARVEAGLQAWERQGRAVAEPLALAQQVKPALEAGEYKQAETLLDNALAMLDEPAPAKPELPEAAATDLYGADQEITLNGYEGEAMEAAISPDGQTLFFNNENAAGDATDIHFATRTGDLTFDYNGRLSGVNVAKLDAVPSIDDNNRFYFTSLRSYAENLHSLYTGVFKGSEVLDLRAVQGEISPKTPGEINMDACISFDGRTLYISRARFENGVPVPKESDLMAAVLEGKGFRIDPGSFSTFINVNSDALEYAPAISADGRELYFTRAIPGGEPRLMVAMRESAVRPFGAPKTISTIPGFVEAPSIPRDGQEMFFHRRVDGKFRLFRALRKQ